MAIQMRRGLLADFDASKMLPGEFAVTIDEVLATREDFEQDLANIQQAIEDAREASKTANEAIDKANQIIAGKVGIDDTQLSGSTVYSSEKTDQLYVKKTEYDKLVEKVNSLVSDLSNALVSR